MTEIQRPTSSESYRHSTSMDISKRSAPFRDYDSCRDKVKRTYYEMHAMQSMEFVQEKIKQWCRFTHGKMNVMDALDKLNGIIDDSDPDVDVPNIIHAFQTAESIRKKYPENGWLQLVGLIHDLGKLLAYWGEPQSSVVGDTFPVGCAFSDKIVFGTESFVHNVDMYHPVYSTKLGIYKENCGIRNVLMSWGHDEYLYRVLKNHPECRLPEEGLDVIRFHSFYPWHTCHQYKYLCDESDTALLKLVQDFNAHDLYSKDKAVPDIEALKPYYQELIDKYLPGVISW